MDARWKRTGWTGALVGLGLGTLASGAGGGPAGGGPAPAVAAEARARADTGAAAARRGSFRSGAADREAVSLTVYNQDFGLVREIRGVELARGPVALQFGDVAARIQTETVHIRPLDGRSLRVLEQNYQYDLLSPQKLLEKYVGRTVTVYRWNEREGRDEAVEAEVLAVNQGTILKIGDEITFNYPGRIAFPEVPDNLIAEPTLVWLLDSGAPRQRLEVSYLSGGLDWKADYVMILDQNDAAGDLTGWVTLTNQSGVTYEDARLKLVAGDVQRVEREDMMKMAARAAADAVGEGAPFSEEAFFEYHLYTLDRPTTVRDSEQKQVTLLEARDFGVRKRLIFPGAGWYYRGSHGHVTADQKVGVFLDLRNTEENGLGMPLPAGVVRVYKEDSSGARQFVGEDRIDHTPRDERVRIKLGEAFDVVGDRRQMEYDVLGSCTAESAWKVELRNHKDEEVEVELVEPAGGDWTIVSSTHPATRVDAHTFTFTVDVPERGSTTVAYRVRVRWC